MRLNAAGNPKDYRGFPWSKIIDTMVGSVAHGDILYRGASAWARLAAGTAGKVLTTNGTGADPSWETFTSLPNSTFAKYKTADETRTSTTTLTNDDTLFCTLSANKKYRIDHQIFFDTSATPDFSYDWNFTGTLDSLLVRTLHTVWDTASMATGSTDSTHQMVGQLALNLTRNFTIAGNDTIPLIGVVDITVGGSGGTFSFRWAQRVSSGSGTTVRRNSNIIVTDCS